MGRFGIDPLLLLLLLLLLPPPPPPPFLTVSWTLTNPSLVDLAVAAVRPVA